MKAGAVPPWAGSSFTRAIERKLKPVRYLDLVKILSSRNLKVRYRGSFLGVFWSLSNPILMTVVYTGLFGTAFRSYYQNSVVSYSMACFTGVALMTFFISATSQALSSIVANGTLLNKVQLPVSIFPVSMIAAHSFQFVVGILPVLLILTLVRSHSLLNVVVLPLPLLGLAMISMGLGLFLSGLFVFFRDLPYLYELVGFMFWITSPIFYPLELVPANIKPIISLNPVTAIIVSVRQISLSTAAPDFRLIGFALLAGAIVLVAGSAFFIKVKSSFMDLL